MSLKGASNSMELNEAIKLNETNLTEKIGLLDKAIKRKEALSAEITRLEEEERMLLHSLKSEFGDNYEEEAEKLLQTLSSVEKIFETGVS